MDWMFFAPPVYFRIFDHCDQLMLPLDLSVMQVVVGEGKWTDWMSATDQHLEASILCKTSVTLLTIDKMLKQHCKDLIQHQEVIYHKIIENRCLLTACVNMIVIHF